MYAFNLLAILALVSIALSDEDLITAWTGPDCTGEKFESPPKDETDGRIRPKVCLSDMSPTGDPNIQSFSVSISDDPEYIWINSPICDPDTERIDAGPHLYFDFYGSDNGLNLEKCMEDVRSPGSPKDRCHRHKGDDGSTCFTVHNSRWNGKSVKALFLHPLLRVARDCRIENPSEWGRIQDAYPLI